LELRPGRVQLVFELTGTVLDAGERLLELIGSRVLGGDGSVELVGAAFGAFGVGAESALLLALRQQLLLEVRDGGKRLVALGEGRGDTLVTVQRRPGPAGG